MVKRSTIILGSAVSLLIALAALREADRRGRPTHGPLQCGACALAIPAPDAATTRYINAWIAAKKDETNGDVFRIQSGDRVRVCNDTTCVTYRRAGSAGWRAKENASSR